MRHSFMQLYPSAASLKDAGALLEYYGKWCVGGGGRSHCQATLPVAHLHINRVRYETVILRILNVRNMHLSECQFYVHEITSENYLVVIFRGINLNFIHDICSV